MLVEFTKQVLAGEDLEEEQIKIVMDSIFDQKANELEIASFLTALSAKRESVNEIKAAVMCLKERGNNIEVDRACRIDTCGTGGDGSSTFNVSTISALVLATAGATVLKHGNRSVSSKCGSADVLEALGVRLDLNKHQVKNCIEETGFGFLFAPQFHPVMKNVAPIRKQLGIRTIFNLLGPLSNPGNVEYQLLGVFDASYTELYAQVLSELGIKRAMVVHGMDGMDEITLTDQTKVSELRDGQISTYYITPEDFGILKTHKEELIAGNIEENKQIALDICQAKMGPRADMVILNTGASLYLTGKAETIQQGVEFAREIITSGAVFDKLKDIVKVSCKEGGAIGYAI